MLGVVFYRQFLRFLGCAPLLYNCVCPSIPVIPQAGHRDRLGRLPALPPHCCSLHSLGEGRHAGAHAWHEFCAPWWHTQPLDWSRHIPSSPQYSCWIHLASRLWKSMLESLLPWQGFELDMWLLSALHFPSLFTFQMVLGIPLIDQNRKGINLFWMKL